MKEQILAQIVTLALLVQSCVAYHSTSVPINQATNQGRAQIVTMEGNKTLLRSIEERDGQYYGILLKGNILVPLDSASVAAIYMYDQKKSRTQTVVLVTGVTLGIILGLVMLGAYSLANAVADIVFVTL